MNAQGEVICEWLDNRTPRSFIECHDGPMCTTTTAPTLTALDLRGDGLWAITTTAGIVELDLDDLRARHDRGPWCQVIAADPVAVGTPLRIYVSPCPPWTPHEWLAGGSAVVTAINPTSPRE